MSDLQETRGARPAATSSLWSAPEEPRAPTLSELLRESLPIVLCHRGWFAAVVAVALLYAALEPVQGVIIKRIVEGLQGRTQVPQEVLFASVPWYVALLIGLAVLSFCEKVLKGFYDPRLIFALQRAYLERRHAHEPAKDVSRMQYDCMYGRKALEVFARDVWMLGFTVVSVLLFQMTLAPAWLPALLAVTAPVAIVVLLLGVRIVRSNQAMFDAVEYVAACAAPERRHELDASQSHLHRRIKCREAWMGASEVLMSLLIWIGCLGVVLLARWAPGIATPRTLDAGGLALFVVNVHLLSRPLIEMGKAYNKFCSNVPALRRTLTCYNGTRPLR